MKGFDYKTMAWSDLPTSEGAELMPLVPVAAEALNNDKLLRCNRQPCTARPSALTVTA